MSTVTVEGNRCELFCSKVDLVKQLEYWFGCGAANKKIPFEVLRWPSEIQAALFDAYMEGDGGAGGQASTVSRSLAAGLYALGIQCSRPVTVSWRDAYTDKDGYSSSGLLAFVSASEREFGRLLREARRDAILLVDCHWYLVPPAGRPVL